MPLLVPASRTFLSESDVEDAPFGSLVFRTSNADGGVYTPYKPINIERKYKLRGWIRRTS